MERLCLLTVHAHPDDEASKGAGSVARYHAEGVRTVLVCCTGGEAGDILVRTADQTLTTFASLSPLTQALSKQLMFRRLHVAEPFRAAIVQVLREAAKT